jgi:hypothetical protein
MGLWELRDNGNDEFVRARDPFVAFAMITGRDLHYPLAWGRAFLSHATYPLPPSYHGSKAGLDESSRNEQTSVLRHTEDASSAKGKHKTKRCLLCKRSSDSSLWRPAFGVPEQFSFHYPSPEKLPDQPEEFAVLDSSF